MQEILLNLRYFERGSFKNPLKNLTLYFLLNPVSFNEQSYQEQKGPGTSDQLLFMLQTSSQNLLH